MSEGSGTGRDDEEGGNDTPPEELFGVYYMDGRIGTLVVKVDAMDLVGSVVLDRDYGVATLYPQVAAKNAGQTVGGGGAVNNAGNGSQSLNGESANTGDRVEAWGYAEVLVQDGIASTILYAYDEDREIEEVGVLELTVHGN